MLNVKLGQPWHVVLPTSHQLQHQLSDALVGQCTPHSARRTVLSQKYCRKNTVGRESADHHQGDSTYAYPLIQGQVPSLLLVLQLLLILVAELLTISKYSGKQMLTGCFEPLWDSSWSQSSNIESLNDALHYLPVCKLGSKLGFCLMFLAGHCTYKCYVLQQSSCAHRNLNSPCRERPVTSDTRLELGLL
jgi:hypothetical protein